tara:strand:+ start:6818 stop:7261 length:444 start_codon:yes stop_codon:yes gene_type:complete
MKIREAKKKDIDNLSILFNSYREFYGKESDMIIAKKFIESRINLKDSRIFVCELKDDLVGFVQLYPIFSSTRVSKYWILNDLFVNKENRGRGFSKFLIKRAQKLVVMSNACGMLLETEKTNIIGNKLYPSTGFQEYNESNFYEWTPN